MTTTTSTSRRSSSNDRRIAIVCSTRADGDFHLTNQTERELDVRRRAFVDLPWTMTDQRHGTTVVRVTEPSGGDRSVGDVAITDLDDVVLGCWAGDCAPLVLVGAEREFAVAHAGWRGLAAGVVDAAFDAFTEPVVEVLLGPAIWPCCYEFGVDDIPAVAHGVHASPAELRSSTSRDQTALDVPAAVRAAAAHRGVDVSLLGACTGCTYDGYSHRARRDPERHILAAWRPSR